MSCLADRHKSFKLRLPSIRRELRKPSRGGERASDVENPPVIYEEETPLQSDAVTADVNHQSNGPTSLPGDAHHAQ